MPSTRSLALPSGMLPPIVSGDCSLEVFTRTHKHRAMNRSDYFRLQACARAVLRFLIARGRGKRCRSWWSARRIAAAIPRSGLVAAYSVHHVRRAIKQLEDAGLVRCTIVRAGERFPRGETPDVDGGGELAYEGGRVREVNMAALLGEGPVWDAPVRRLRLVTTSTADILEEGAELAGTDVEAAAAAAQLRGLVELEALEDAAPSSPAAAAEPGGEGILCDPWEGILHADRILVLLRRTITIPNARRSGTRRLRRPGRPLTRESRASSGRSHRAIAPHPRPFRSQARPHLARAPRALRRAPRSATARARAMGGKSKSETRLPPLRARPHAASLRATPASSSLRASRPTKRARGSRRSSDPAGRRPRAARPAPPTVTTDDTPTDQER